MTRTREAVVIDALRTPTGKGRPSGQLAEIHPSDLLATTLEGLVRRTGVDPERIEDVIAGCVSQAGEQGSNIARVAALGAGLPETVPGTTIDRKCGSSQQAVHFAAQAVLSGTCDAVIACGVESMSRVPMFSAVGAADPYGERFAARFPEGLVHQGISAELVAARWGLDRDDLDTYAARSHARLLDADERGDLDTELLPVDVGGRTVTRDEGVRAGTTAESLSGLPPAFETAEMSDRFPEIGWHVHAGNSSQIADGASAALIVSTELATELDLQPLARFRSLVAVGSDPLLMLSGVIPATRLALKRSGLDLSDIDLFEVNEAFASVPLAWQRELGVDPERLNVNGGAIANGHPLGATGTKLLATLLHELARREVRYGLQTVCEAGGMSNALVLERC